jgi:CubicO group peptidase (beta-lactamase class C family)
MTAVDGGAGAQSSDGSWSAVLDMGTVTLRLRLELDSAGRARLTSVDQGGVTFAGTVSADAGRFDIEFPSIRAAFRGHALGAARIEGRWQQGGGESALVFLRGDAAFAPPEPLTRQRLAALRATAGSPALAAAAVRRQAPVRLWVDGERLAGSGVAVREGDLWHVGSITKSMTSTLIARLVDQGALQWDDTVGGVLGTVAPQMRDAYRGVTLRHLLSHRAGLPANLGPEDRLKFSRETGDARAERRDYVRQGLALEPAGPPATTFLYSNIGYVVAGALLETRLGESWESLIAAHLFGPLGLSTAGFGAPGRPGAVDQPAGHALAGDGTRRSYPVGPGITDNPAVLGPAGRVHMSLQDLLRYLAAHRDQADLLRPESWTMLHTPPFGGDYALGWFRRNGRLWHSGSNTLWYAEVLVDAGAGVAAAAAANDGTLAESQPAVARALREAAAAA